VSYYSTVGGSSSFAGAGYHALSGALPIRRRSSEVRALQQELQRLGYLQEGSGVQGADGIFGPRTAAALAGAAQYVGWTGAPYSPPDAGDRRSGTVSVPDDLIDRLRGAPPNPHAPFSDGDPSTAIDAPVDPSPQQPRVTIGPSLDPPQARHGNGTQGSGADRKWVLPTVAGVLILAGGVMLGFGFHMQQTQQQPVRTNRRRRSRRR
jgi:peptidoglycan hydrolase-like protein with peptidoglycan-binding domain